MEPLTATLTANCPLCDSPISEDKFAEITKIREREQQMLAKAKAEMEGQFQSRLKVETEAAKKLAAGEAEQRVTEVLDTLRQVEARETAAHKQAEEAEKRLTSLTAERHRNAGKVKELEAREATIRKQATAEAELKAKKELDQERLVLKKDLDTALLKKESGFSHERESYQKKLLQLQRQLEQKTANELGEVAAGDLFETLREAFPDDRIARVPNGEEGADIHHKVAHNGEPCGLIIYDSKNHQQWRYQFATKLRDDKIKATAEYAILCTVAFPKGKKGPCGESEVIVVTPTQAPYVASLVRQFLIKMHVLGLSQKERAGKSNRLYQLITAGEFGQQLSLISSLNQELQDVDVQEQTAHSKVWKKRGELLKKQQNALREIETDIAAIVEDGAESETSAA